MYGTDYWEAEAIEDHRRTEGSLEYLVLYKPVDGKPAERAWEPAGYVNLALKRDYHGLGVKVQPIVVHGVETCARSSAWRGSRSRS